MKRLTSQPTPEKKLPDSLCRGSGGFSLLEMMVASSLLVVIMLGLLAMFYQTERALRIGANQTDILNGGRSAMQLVTRDLSQMASAGESNILNFAVTDRFETGPLELAPGEWRSNHVQTFYFLQKENDLWKGVRYDFDSSEIASGAGALFRMEVTPGRFPTPPDIAATDLTNSARSVYAFIDDPFRFPPYTNWFGQIVEGVVNMTINAYDQEGNLVFGPPLNPAGFSYTFFGTNLPAYVELELAVMEPKTLDQFRALADAAAPDPTPSLNFLAQQAGKVHVFRQRIPIRQTVLP